LVLCFKVSQLLAFYGRTVEQMMGSGARLTDTLADCHRLANRVFHEQLTARGNKLMQFKAAPPKDLALPQQVLRPDYMCWDAELTAYLSCCAVLSCAELCCLVLCWFADRWQSACEPNSSMNVPVIMLGFCCCGWALCVLLLCMQAAHLLCSLMTTLFLFWGWSRGAAAPVALGLLHHAQPQADTCLSNAQVAELLHQLRELITTFVSAFNTNQEQRKAEEEFAPILDAIIDPALQMCKNSSALLNNKR